MKPGLWFFIVFFYFNFLGQKRGFLGVFYKSYFFGGGGNGVLGSGKLTFNEGPGGEKGRNWNDYEGFLIRIF